ncbi:hypothetical protein [Nannocystis sp. SCPEA4]|uniref:hypothetical protein n=1 Tax=Nannocystis sp. SCPEA4 TaxID=2996787 RepID=UPI002271439A|nr:hypothetical protein [Nannocystis sp. SCPEA4]MCY1061606.1 hypothetical protein [Nannocystis sp. SCPEA4]
MKYSAFFTLLLGMWTLPACTEKSNDSSTEATSSTSSTGATATSSSATSTSSSVTEAGTSTTGPLACALMVGPSDEPVVQDPDGCFAAADEAACLAVEDQCTALYGVPMTCTDDTWCAPDPAASVYLGCRPFTICKPNAKAICREGPGGVEGFWTWACTPEGFGHCRPKLQETVASAPPECE